MVFGVHMRSKWSDSGVTIGALGWRCRFVQAQTDNLYNLCVRLSAAEIRVLTTQQPIFMLDGSLESPDRCMMGFFKNKFR